MAPLTTYPLVDAVTRVSGWFFAQHVADRQQKADSAGRAEPAVADLNEQGLVASQVYAEVSYRGSQGRIEQVGELVRQRLRRYRQFSQDRRGRGPRWGLGTRFARRFSRAAEPPR